MAVWQWDVWLVPKEEITKHFQIIPQYMDLDWFESIDWWNAVSEKQMAAFFEGVLPDYFTPWAKNTRSWGSDLGDRVELTVHEGKITDMVIRIDLRNLNTDFLMSLLDLAEKKHFLFFSLESRKFIEPTAPKLFQEINNSRKMLFIKNPDEFFEDKTRFDKITKENLRKINEND
jgi:hypothetical protein